MTVGEAMIKHYDVIIVGGGPAGIFAALEIAQSSALSVTADRKRPGYRPAAVSITQPR